MTNLLIVEGITNWLINLQVFVGCLGTFKLQVGIRVRTVVNGSMELNVWPEVIDRTILTKRASDKISVIQIVHVNL